MPPFCNCGCLLPYHVDVGRDRVELCSRLLILEDDLVGTLPGILMISRIRATLPECFPPMIMAMLPVWYGKWLRI